VRKVLRWFIVTVALASVTAACVDKPPPQEIPIRIGWQVSWATQGQLATILKRTNLLEINGLQGEFVGFSYGGPLNEGALSGRVDVIFTADQPAAHLLAKGAEWTIVGRLIYNRTGIVVPMDSEVKTVRDLEGKTISIPFGAAAHRNALISLRAAGLDPAVDARILNLDILEQVGVVQGRGDWGEVDAFVTWDPPLANYEHKNFARVLDISRVVSVIVMADRFIQDHPGAATRFLKAYLEAYAYYARDQKRADQWFKEESQLAFDLEVLEKAAEVEPNLEKRALSEMDIFLSDEDIRIIQSGADFIRSEGLTKTKVDMASKIDQSHLRTAAAELDGVTLDSLGIKAAH